MAKINHLSNQEQCICHLMTMAECSPFLDHKDLILLESSAMSKVTEEGALAEEESCILKDTWVSDVTCTKKPLIFSRSHR